MDISSPSSDPVCTLWTPPLSKTWTSNDGQAMLAAHRASGLSITAFIKHYGLSAQRYYYWRDKLAQTPSSSRTVKPSAQMSIRKVKIVDIPHRIPVTSPIGSTLPLQAWIGSIRIQIEAQTCNEALKKLLKVVLPSEKDGDDSTR